MDLNENRPASNALGVASDGKSGWSQRLLIFALFLLNVVDGIDQQALAFTAPQIMHEFNLEYASMGGALGVAYFGGALGGVIFGTIADARGRKAALLIAALLVSAGSLLTVSVDTLGGLILVRFLSGLALGGLYPVAVVSAYEMAPLTRRATAVTLVATGVPVGAASCGPLVAMLTQDFGWRSIFVVGGLVPLLVSVLPALLMPGLAAEEAGRAGDLIAPSAAARLIDSVSPLFAGKLWKVTVLIWITFCLIAAPMFFAIGWLPTLVRIAGMTPRTGATGMLIFFLSGPIASVAIARAMDRVGVTVLAWCALISAPALILLGGSLRQEVAFPVMCGITGALLVSTVNIFGSAVVAAAYDPRLRARASGWALAIMRAGAGTAPWVGGLLISRGWSASALFMSAAVGPSIAAGAILLLARKVGPLFLRDGAQLTRTRA